MLSRLTPLWILCSVLMCVPGAFAQTRSIVAGTVMDASGGVLPGATVTLESAVLLGGTQTAVTGTGGTYRFAELPPGAYTLTTALDGFRTVRREDIRVLFSTTVTVDVVLPVAGVSDVVTVTAAAPAVDVRTAAATVKIDEDLLQRLPLMADRRTAFEVFALSPGITGRSAFGGARDANALLMDGTPTTVPNSQGTNAAVLNTNWLEEVQVVALGASAEYGEFTGMGANFVVRSGSNVRSGLFEYLFTRDAWLADNMGSLPAAIRSGFSPPEIVSYWDLTVQTGGPIQKDRLFLFSGFQYFNNEQQRAGAPSPMRQRWPRLVNKATWAATTALRVEGLLNLTKSSSEGGGTPTSTPETAGITEQPTYLWNGRATWTPRSDTLVELRQSGSWYEQDIGPAPPNTKAGPPPRRDTFTGISSVNAAQFRLQQGTRHLSAATLTRFAPNLAGGAHEIKAGVEFERLRFLQESGFPGGLSFQDFNGAPNLVTIWAGNRVMSTGRRATFYVQDRWQIGRAVTLQPGIRVVTNRGAVPGRGTVYRTTPIDPRFGVAWDIASDHRTVVRAHYGRFHEPLAGAEYSFMHTSGISPQVTARVTGPDQFVVINPGTAPQSFDIDPALRQAHMDQYVVGVEREVLPSLSMTVQYVRRSYARVFGFVDTGSQYAPVQALDPGPDGRPGTADDGGTVTIYNLVNPGESFLVYTNPDGASRQYNALQVIAQKRFGNNWQFLGGYTWSRSEGTTNNNQGHNLNVGVYTDPNASINRDGRTAFDFPHELTLRGTYRVPILAGIHVSGAYKYVTGAAWGRQVVFRGLRQGNVTVLVEPRGSRRIEATNQLNVRMETAVALGSAKRTLSVYADVFNVTNQGVVDRDRLVQTSGPTFMVPQNWANPRWLQIGVRARF